MINPAAEAPVSNKNFFRSPLTFSFTVKNINAPPNKQKTVPEMMINRKPINNSLAAGITNTQAITIKTPTSAQNIAWLNFPSTVYHLKIMRVLGIATNTAAPMNTQPVHIGNQVASSRPNPTPKRNLAPMCRKKYGFGTCLNFSTLSLNQPITHLLKDLRPACFA